MQTGLVSVTFRNLEADVLIELVKKAGMDGIEWGGDVHVPDLASARKVAGLMEQSGLKTISYGSYYRAGEAAKNRVSGPSQGNFEEVLEIAKTLQAPNIRVWAGSIDSEEAGDVYRMAVVRDLNQICNMAAKEGITVSVEYHSRTLTNTQASTLKLLEEVPELFTYWQPLSNTTYEENLRNVGELSRLGRLQILHAYHWENQMRLPFEDGSAFWKEYIRLCKDSCTAVLLEFVMNDNEAQFLEDAKVLRSIMKEVV